MTIWFKPTPRWDGLLGRWVKPDEPEYEQGLERLRHPRGRAALDEERASLSPEERYELEASHGYDADVGQPRCGGSGELVERISPPGVDHRDPAFETREMECPGCPDCRVASRETQVREEDT